MAASPMIWLGQEVELSLGQVEYQGALQQSILVKPISRPTEKRPLPQRKCAGLGNLDDEFLSKAQTREVGPHKARLHAQSVTT